MPAPVATIPLYQLLTGITALGVGKGVQQTLENLDEGQLEQRFTDTFKRLLLGPLASVRHTPSGLVIGPETPEQAKPGILATFSEAEQGIQTTSTPIPTGTPKGIVGLPMPETQEKLKGFEKPQDVDMKILYKKENNLPSLTEVNLESEKPFDITDTSSLDTFPFNPVDFKKNGVLNNSEIIKAFNDIKNDVKIKPPIGFNLPYMVLQQSDSFYITPPRAQMEIALKYLEKQLEENKASEETLNLIKNLNKDLQTKIKNTGYYGVNKKTEEGIINLPGMTDKLKKLKSSN